MAPPLLLLQDVRFSIGATALLRGAALSVSPGERLALVGRNGSMEALRDGIGKLRRALSDPGLYARDRARFDRFTAALAAQEAELDAAEEEWLALELLREEIEGA